VSDEVANDVVLAVNEVATNAVLYGSCGGQPVEVAVHVTHDWVEASVLDHGPEPPPGLPAEADTDDLRAGGRGLGCCAGWWMRCDLNGSSSAPG
jgi:anti-sigma regulatory factor (Ser/Thr protein kinase)